MKAKTAIVLTVFALAGLSGHASADETYDQCVGAPNSNANTCGDAWLARAQSALDAKWQSVIALTDGAVADALASEQTFWTAFKNASCAFMSDATFAPGGDRTSFYACRAGVIADRLTEVEGYMRYIDN